MTTSSNPPRCQQCQNEIAQGLKFCTHCGSDQESPPATYTSVKCEKCQSELGESFGNASEKFCPRCGGRSFSVDLHKTDYTLALEAYGQNEYEKAIGYLCVTIRHYPESATAYFLRGSCHHELGQTQLAIEDYDESIRIDPQNATSYIARSAAYNDLGQYDRVVEDYDNALKVEPENRNYLEGRDTFARLAQSTSEADASTTTSTESTLSPTLSSIQCYKCQSEVAINSKFCPECGEPTGVTRCVQCQNEVSPGDKFCPECGATIAELHPTEGVEANSYPSEQELFTLHEAAQTAIDAGDFERAIQNLDKAIELKPQFADIFNPQFADVFCNRGLAYGNMGRFERALQDYDRAIELNPQLAMAHNNKGWAYINLGQFYLAIDSLDEAIKLDPEGSLAYYNRANAYEQLGQRERANQDFEEARKLDPNTSRVWSVLSGGWSVLKFAAGTLVIILVGWFAWSCVGAVDETISTWDEDIQRYEDEWEAEVQEEADRIERETREWKAQNPIPSY